MYQQRSLTDAVLTDDLDCSCWNPIEIWQIQFSIGTEALVLPEKPILPLDKEFAPSTLFSTLLPPSLHRSRTLARSYTHKPGPQKRKIHNKLTNRIRTLSNPQTFQSIMHRGSLYLVTFSIWTMTMDCSCPPPLGQSSPRWWRGSSRRRRPRRPKKPRKAQ